MNSEMIMKLVDAYASEACNHGLYGGIHWHKQQIAARAVVVATLEQLTEQQKHLTDEQIESVCVDVHLKRNFVTNLEKFVAIARAIEAAHNIKGNT